MLGLISAYFPLLTSCSGSLAAFPTPHSPVRYTSRSVSFLRSLRATNSSFQLFQNHDCLILLVTQVFITPVSTVLNAIFAATSGNAGTVSKENSITSPA